MALLPREGGLTTGPAAAGSRRPFAWPAATFGLAAAAAAVVRSGQAFDHGRWLAAYLGLVGGLSQLILGEGQRILAGHRASGPPRRLVVAELVLWNLGSVLVPVGVFASAPAAVGAGSIALLAALTLFTVATSASPGRDRVQHRLGLYAYRAVILFLAGSVLVGTGLAEAFPWQ